MSEELHPFNNTNLPANPHFPTPTWNWSNNHPNNHPNHHNHKPKMASSSSSTSEQYTATLQKGQRAVALLVSLARDYSDDELLAAATGLRDLLASRAAGAPQKEKPVCKDFLVGRCKRKQCRLSHSQAALEKERERLEQERWDALRRDYNWTPLHNAAFYGCIRTVKDLITKGHDVNAVTTAQFSVSWGETDERAHEYDSFTAIFPPGSTVLDVALSDTGCLSGPTYATRYLRDTCYGRENREQIIELLLNNSEKVHPK